VAAAGAGAAEAGVEGLLPRNVTATIAMMIITANINAYSTAVGPSSFLRKETILRLNFVMGLSPNRFDEAKVAASTDILKMFLVLSNTRLPFAGACLHSFGSDD